ncbi:MAG: ATP-binding protein [Chloroflexota bacterium]
MTENNLTQEFPSGEQLRQGRFVSMRWRLLSPVFFVVLFIAMGGAYLIARNLSGGLAVSQENLLLRSSYAASEQANDLFAYHRTEAQRLAFTVGVARGVEDSAVELLRPIVETLARANTLDALILTDRDGFEILGLQRVTGIDGADTFALSTDADLSGQTLVRSIVTGSADVETAFLRTPETMLLFTAVPVYLDERIVGAALVGQRVDHVLNDLQNSAISDLVLYGPAGDLLQTTFDDAAASLNLDLEAAQFMQAITAEDALPVSTRTLQNVAYQAAYQPFNFGPNTLGVVGVFMPDDVPLVNELGRQLTALLAAALTGAVVLVSGYGISRYALRAQTITDVAEQLTAGAVARTRMQPIDEISAIGQALDQYADTVQAKHNDLERALRRRRRELHHLLNVLDSMPDGVVIQDRSGRVLMINEPARSLIGAQQAFIDDDGVFVRGSVGETLGAEVAPGLYIMGDTRRLALGERIASMQAAAIVSSARRRLGTVLLLRDVTEEVQRETQRDALMRRLSREVQQPLAALGRDALQQANGPTDNRQSQDRVMRTFAREISQRALALQKIVIDMQELVSPDQASVRRQQRPLNLENFIWSVANEWRQIAAASEQTLHVLIEQRGLFILGDESRLRWALGNVLDNAVKYTPGGGAMTLEIKPEQDGNTVLRVRDNGTGILRDERNYVFTRFFRGTPTQTDGTVIHVPGQGQGLFVARQIIEAHGGNIRLKSTPGVGTAVYILLPLTEPQAVRLPAVETADMEGETVQLPVTLMSDLDRED